MEVATKTDVDIIQELLGMYTDRKEAIEKIEGQTNDASFREDLDKLKVQTDGFVSELMDQLSLYGDAVMGEVNRNTPYFSTWKASSPQVAEMNEVDLHHLFELLEKQLADYYQQINADRSNEAGSLDEVLAKQEAELKV